MFPSFLVIVHTISYKLSLIKPWRCSQVHICIDAPGVLPYTYQHYWPAFAYKASTFSTRGVDSCNPP